jgi:hypothetical protein
MNILDGQTTNDIISEKLALDVKFNYMRFGMGFETIIPYHICNNMPLNNDLITKAHLHSGLYGDMKDIEYYHELFLESVKNRDIFLKWNVNWLNPYENYFLDKNKKDNCIYTEAGSNEAFRYKNPFSKQFEGKKILVVSLFANTIKKQFENRKYLFKDKDVLPEFELITYKSVASFCMEKPHSGWRESYEIMRDDISKLDFDIALVGCASYSQPLINFIYSDMNKTAMNIAGGLPLYFGILGKRWENDGFVKDINKEYWVKPSEDEKPEKANQIEVGCYW